MNIHADQTQENKSQAVSAVDSQMQSGSKSTFQFVDKRPEAVSQLRAFQDMANNSPQAKQLAQLQAIHKSRQISAKRHNSEISIIINFIVNRYLMSIPNLSNRF